MADKAGDIKEKVEDVFDGKDENGNDESFGDKLKDAGNKIIDGAENVRGKIKDGMGKLGEKIKGKD